MTLKHLNEAVMGPVCRSQEVGIETEKVSKEKAVADGEEQKVAAIAVVVSGKQRDCEEDLAKAEPALLAAQDALNTLNKVSRSLSLIDPLHHTFLFGYVFVLCLISFSQLAGITYVHTGRELHGRLFNPGL